MLDRTGNRGIWRDRVWTALWRIPQRSGCRRCKTSSDVNLSGERTELEQLLAYIYDYMADDREALVISLSFVTGSGNHAF